MYILDSDIFDILVFPNPARARVRAKIAAVGSLNVWFSIITVYEKLFNGLLPELNKVMNKRESVRQFDAIIALLDEIAKWQILPFTAKDYENFKDIYSVVKKRRWIVGLRELQRLGAGSW